MLVSRCLNPLSAGHFFKPQVIAIVVIEYVLIPFLRGIFLNETFGADWHAVKVLIPFLRGIFLNVEHHLIRQRSRVLIPFLRGIFLNQKKQAKDEKWVCLNPLSAGHFFKRFTKHSYG